MADENLLLRGELELDVRNAEKKVADVKKQLALAIQSNNRSKTTNTVLLDRIEKLKKTLSDAQGELNKAKRSLDDLGTEGSKSLSELDTTAGRLTKTLGTVFSVTMAKEFVERVVSTRSQFQQLEVAFTTLLKSEDKANQLMADAVELAAKTPFDLQGVADGARQLIAYGFASDEVIEDMRRLGDVAAGLGLPLQRLTYLYGTTRVQGRLYARDMLQFTNSGIPMLDQLAKMYGKTTKQINEMVSAGKIGFEDIKKAIYAMTSEGGQFANLMEKQSKTIGGQISNIGDAIDQMFNEIGKKSEGAINTTLGLVSKLVDNYEKVGKALGAVAVTYGTAKAASMAYLAIEKSNLVAAKGYSAALAQKAAAARLATLEQKALNAAIKASPYVLAGAAVAGLAYQMYHLSQDTSAAAKAQSELESVSVLLDAKYEQEMATLKRLKGQLDSAEEGTTAWNRAKNELVSTFSKYEKNLLSEITDVNSLSAAYEKLTTDITEAAKVRGYESFVGAQSTALSNEVTNTLGSVQKRLEKYFGKGGEEEAGSLFSRVISYIHGEIGELDTEEWKVLNAASGGFAGANRLLNPLNTMVINAQKDVAKLKTINDDAAAAFGITPEMMKKYASGTTVTPPVKDNSLSDKELNRQYNLLKKGQEQIQKLNREKAQMQIDAQQRELDMMDDGYEKNRRQNELNFQKELLSIRNQREDKLKELQEYEKSQWMETDPNRKERDFKTTITQLPEEMAAMYDRMEEDALTKWANANAKANLDALKNLSDTESKKLAITTEYENKIAAVREALAGADKPEDKAIYEKQIKQYEDEMRLALADVDYDEILNYGSLEDAVAAMREKLTAEMAKLPEELQGEAQRQMNESLDEFIVDYAEGGRDAALSQLYNRLADEGIRALEKELAKAQAVVDGLTADGENGSALAEAQRQIALLTAMLNRKKQNKDVQDISVSLGDVASVADEAASAFDNLGDAIGGTTGEAIKNLGQMVSVTGSAVSAISKLKDALNSDAKGSDLIMAVTSGVSGAVGAAVAAFSLVTSIVNSNAEANRNAANSAREYTQSLQAMADERTMSKFENAFGTDSYGTFQAMNNQLEDAKKNMEGLQGEFGDTMKIRNYGKAVLLSMSPITAVTGRSIAALTKAETVNADLIADMRSDWQKFWGSTKNIEAKNLADFYDEAGNLDGEALAAWYDEYGEYLDDNTKTLVDSLLNEWERYETAMESMNDYLSSLFGDTAGDIADSMISSFLKSGDALTDLTDISNNFAKSLAKSTVTSMLMEDVFTEEAQDNIKNLLLQNNAAGAVDAYNKLLEDANAKAPAITEFLQGLNLTAEEAERTAAQGGLAQASQDSVNELNGRATVIQSHTFQMNENVKAIAAQNAALVAYSSDILSEVRGIHDDTGRLNDKLDGVLDLQNKVNGNITWIIDKGIRAN